MRAGWHSPGLRRRLCAHPSTFETIVAVMASTCEHTHGASAPRPRRAAVRAGSHHAPASAAISASAWPPRRRPQLVTSLKRRPTKISEQNRNSEIQNASVQMHFFPLAKPLAVIILLLLSGEQVGAGAVLPRPPLRRYTEFHRYFPRAKKKIAKSCARGVTPSVQNFTPPLRPDGGISPPRYEILFIQ